MYVHGDASVYAGVNLGVTVQTPVPACDVQSDRADTFEVCKCDGAKVR